MAGRYTGSILHRYTLPIPADPGWNDPDAHRRDVTTPAPERDQSTAGGGWQPESWDGGLVVLPGDFDHDLRTHDRIERDHDGDAATTGRAQPWLAYLLQLLGGASNQRPETYEWAGAAGAAHGGLVATGVSAPWANPGGLDLGTRYVRLAEQRHPGLHLNRPKIRIVRANTPVVERSSPPPGPTGGRQRTSMFDPHQVQRGGGPSALKLRRIIKPYGQTDYTGQDVVPEAAPILDAGAIGGDWAL